MNIDEVIDKIRKAVRLANRTNEEGERETALRLARGLAEKNGIAFEDVAVTQSDTGKAVHEEESEYHTNEGVELGHACFIIQQHFGVILMLHHIRGKAWKSRRSWFGSRLNIDIAKHVFHILMRESRRAYAEECRKPREKEFDEWLRKMSESLPERQMDFAVKHYTPRKVSRKSFMQGFFFAIDQKLTEHPLRNDLDADRLAAQKKFDEYRENHKVRNSNGRKNSNPDADAIAAGFAAGNKMNLARPCDGASSSPLALAM